MRITKYKRLFLLLFLVMLISCNNSYEVSKNIVNNALEIDSIKISYNELDATVNQELFDELNRIYNIRKIAAEVLIENKLLVLEAKAKNLTIEELKEELYRHKLTDSLRIKFIKLNSYEKGVKALERGLIIYDDKSLKGKELIELRLKSQILKQFIDSLKTVHDIKLFLKAPKPPVIKIKNLMTYYKGNLDAKITFLQISDLECSMCREYAPVFEELYVKYKDKVKFGFTQFGSYMSSSAIAAESAARQGKFWQMHDSIAFSEFLPEVSDINRIAKNIGLDIDRFKKDYESKEIKDNLEHNFETLDAAGIYGTPTIMINNRLIYNSSSINEIEELLIEEIAKSN